MKIIATVFNIFLITFLFFPKVANAQLNNVMANVPEVPDYSADLEKKDFINGSVLFEEVPFGDKYLAYSIRLPTGWKKSDDTSFNTVGQNTRREYIPDDKGEDDHETSLSVNRRLLGEVARYFGPVKIGPISKIAIHSLELDYEITARNWLINYVLSNGYTLKGMKVLSDRRVEAAYVTLEKDTAYFVRMVAEINGPRIVLIKYSIPDQYFKEERAWQQYAIKSFTFKNPEKATIEMTRSYQFLDLIKFNYPSSWRLIAPNIYSLDGMDAKLINTKNDRTLSGEIKISFVSTELETSIVQEVKYAREELLAMGLFPGELLGSIEDYHLHDHIYFNRIEVYEAKDKKERILDHEYWIAVMVEDRYYYIISMLTPGRDMDFYSWARNTEAFKTVVESVRPFFDNDTIEE